MAEEINVDRDWSLTINMSGISAPTGKRNVELPEGYYKAMITDAYINPEKNRGRVIFKLTVAEGPFQGVVRTDGLSVPKSKDDKVRYYWRALAESAGFTPAQLDAGEVTIGMGTFKGKTVHIFYQPKSETNQYENVTYLAPAEWENQSKMFAATNGGASAQQSAPAGSAAASTAQLGGGNTTSRADVMSKLGL